MAEIRPFGFVQVGEVGGLRSETLGASALSAEALTSNRLHGKEQAASDIIVDEEKPWHKHLAKYLALGMSQRDAAKMCDCSEAQVGRLLRTPWFQERLDEAMSSEGSDILSLFKGASTKAFAVLVEIAQDTKAPSASRVASAKEILERHLGKSTQFVEMKSEVIADPVARAKELEDRLKASSSRLLS